MSRNGIIIVNPASGRGKGMARLRTALAGTPLSEWEWKETCAPGDARELAKSVAANGEIVVAAGGDGTLSEVAEGLMGSPSCMAVLPIGTGNDFARALGLGTSLHKAIATIDEGSIREVDMIRWTTPTGKGAAINVAGCGFDAVVARRINEGFRYLRGTSAYVVAVLGSLRSYRPSTINLTVDKVTTISTVMLCAIANATSYGGGMLVAPDAKMDDGLLDVVLVEGLSRGAFLAAFPRVFKGTHVSHPNVRVLRGRSVHIETSPMLPVLSDGELVGETPVTFKIVPKIIRVIGPK